MVAEETPLSGMAEMEAGADAVSQAPGPGVYPGQGEGQCVQRTGAMVERRVSAPERGLADGLFSPPGSGVASGGSGLVDGAARSEVVVNRRIRNRTSGGVGGRRRATSASYPIG